LAEPMFISAASPVWLHVIIHAAASNSGAMILTFTTS
jgi:hypothetical protein